MLDSYEFARLLHDALRQSFLLNAVVGDGFITDMHKNIFDSGSPAYVDWMRASAEKVMKKVVVLEKDEYDKLIRDQKKKASLEKTLAELLTTMITGKPPERFP